MKRFQWIGVVLACAVGACSGGDSAAAAGAGTSGAASGSGAAAGDGALGGSAAGNGTGTGAGATADGGTSGGAGTGATSTALELCGGSCQCSDGVDNDSDGEIDGFDTECVSAGDNDEGTFATGIPGDNRDPKWQDCFFDGNSGAGDDGCRYHTDCLTGAKDENDPDCELSKQCIDYCKPLTPNGCDCFGCCEVLGADGKTYQVMLDAACKEDDLAACRQCVPSSACENTCGECELCPGKTEPDLPDSCGASTPDGGAGTGGGAGTSGSAGTGGGTAGSGTVDPPAYTCDGGETVCRSNSDCTGDTFCSFGCCLQIPPE